MTLYQIFSLIYNFEVQDGEYCLEYPVSFGVHRGCIVAPALSFYKLMTFLLILSVMVPYMLMILLFTLGLRKHLNCDSNQSCLLKLKVTDLFQCWKILTWIIWPVSLTLVLRWKNELACSWIEIIFQDGGTLSLF